jgi:ABC-2 type transport system ATP-binding protein
MAAVIEIEDLRKTYRSVRHGAHRALDGFDMVVESGRIHGFLGPNGSGKTTTLRTLLGLVRAGGGRMRLFGEPVPGALPKVISRIGAIVESPQFFPNFSGRRTLLHLARAGGLPKRRVDEVLEIVGLTDRAGDRVKGYSLGMRQRLAVGSALLKSPDLLILDEPANGLDPAGIREMRDLMRHLVASGATVLLSSHILGEIQQTCDEVTIISRGRRIAAGPVASVLAGQDKGEFRVRVGDQERAVAVLSEAGAAVRREPDSLVVTGVTEPAWITETLAGHGLWLSELAPLRPDLETVFLQLTGDDTAAGAGVRDDLPDPPPPTPVTASAIQDGAA